MSGQQSIVRVRFSTGGNELDEKIAVRQYGFWATHVEALVRNGWALRFDENRAGWYLTSATDSWIKQLIVEVPCSLQSAELFHQFLSDQIGKGYDYRGLAALPRDFDTHHGRTWSCADLVYVALLQAGILQSSPRKLSNVTPRDVMIALGAIVDMPYAEERTRALPETVAARR